MRLRTNREFLYLLGLMATGLIGFGAFYFIASHFASPNSWWQTNPRDRSSMTASGALAIPADHISLPLDQPLDLDGLRLLFRGMESSRTIRIDVILPAMDPDVGYPYRLGMRAARNGFSMAGRRFRLLSARAEQVRLRVLPVE